MLLMGYRSEVEGFHQSCNNGKDWLASNHSSSRTSTSSSSTGALQPARSTSAVMVPLSALAQVDNSEASTSGRGEESCRGAAHLMSGFGVDPSTTFAGVFHAEAVGRAHAFLQDLASAVRQTSNAPQPHRVLPEAMRGLQLPEGCTGCAAFVSKGAVQFLSVGDGLIALSNEAGNRSQTELLRGPEVLSSQVSPDRSMSLASMAKDKKPAFGSIIPVERSAMASAADQPVYGTCQLTQTHQFLLLGSGPLEAAMTADQAIDYIGRSRQQTANAAKSASLLAAECNRILTQKQNKEMHVAVGVVHFRHPAMMRSFSQQLASQEGTSPDSPPRAGKCLASLQTSPSPRRVHYLPPFQSTGKEVVLEPPPPSAFTEAATRSPARPTSGSSSREVPRRIGPAVPDSSGMISSGSLLSRPDMSIPEDHRLSSDSSALQLPPPLLAPVRKAYPSNAEGLHITPEMLSSPSPARKAKIGRAASFNSPDGLWPLPPQRGLPPSDALVRQSSASHFGARSRGGEEGRVRGGLPRNASALSLNSTPPTTSPSESPQARTSFVDVRGTVFPGDDPHSGSVFLGRKSHGDTNALRILLASDSVGHAAVKSAPANLSASLSDSLAEPLWRTLTQSSGTESIGQSHASGSSTLSGRCAVRRVPVIDDSPKGLELLSQGSTVSATTMPLRSSTSNSLAHDFGGVSIGSQVRRTSSDLTSQRWPLSVGGSQPILSRKPSQERTVSWPDMDSAAPGQGLLNSLAAEGRQHSGVVFQSSSFQDSTMGSFGDSAGSLTNA